ncbi:MULTISPECIES: hypothetical protein [Amycolatopsis]|uniref:hypothetical protein n=1 Tax=Amycolatopsis TaxID=1813 RepID=UPI000ABD6512|nr:MULTISPECIES: hypothetical protein [Amycolatopsis]
MEHRQERLPRRGRGGIGTVNEWPCPDLVPARILECGRKPWNLGVSGQEDGLAGSTEVVKRRCACEEAGVQELIVYFEGPTSTAQVEEFARLFVS